MSLFLHGIIFGIGQAVNGNAAGMKLRGLALGGRLSNLAIDGNAAAGGELLDLTFVIGQRPVGDYLQVSLARTVVDLQKAKSALGIAARADPALHANGPSDRILVPGLRHGDPVHAAFLLRNRERGALSFYERK